MSTYGYCRVSTPKQNLQRQIKNIILKYPEAEIITEEYTGTKIDRPKWNKLYKQITEEAAEGENVTVVFDEVSRMSRNADEGFQLYKDLFNRNVNLIFLKEPQINTDVYRRATQAHIDASVDTGRPIFDTFVNGNLELVNELLMNLAEEQIKLAFESAQKEVDYLHHRISEGMQVAKDNGKRVGTQVGDSFTVKKSEPIKQLILKIMREKKGTCTDAEIMSLLKDKKVTITEPNGNKKEVSAKLARNTYYKYKADLKREGRLIHTQDGYFVR